MQPMKNASLLASRDCRAEGTVVEVGGVQVGGERVVLIAGPCSVESREQLLAAARSVKASGASMLRGGAFKPRTSPYDFQGLAQEGLELLAAAREETGLPVVTEVVDTRQVELVGRYADVLQVGARNMQNFALLSAVGELGKPVLLKRGFAATIRELLLAAEYVLAKGNSQVVLCERGIRTFEPSTRNTLDISAVPVLKASTHLPVLVDPSHASGVREYVPALARAAIAAGADGLLVEAHPKPEEALCDGRQSLGLQDFERMVVELRRVALAVGRTL